MLLTLFLEQCLYYNEIYVITSINYISAHDNILAISNGLDDLRIFYLQRKSAHESILVMYYEPYLMLFKYVSVP